MLISDFGVFVKHLDLHLNYNPYRTSLRAAATAAKPPYGNVKPLDLAAATYETSEPLST